MRRNEFPTLIPANRNTLLSRQARDPPGYFSLMVTSARFGLNVRVGGNVVLKAKSSETAAVYGSGAAPQRTCVRTAYLAPAGLQVAPTVFVVSSHLPCLFPPSASFSVACGLFFA